LGGGKAGKAGKAGTAVRAAALASPALAMSLPPVFLPPASPGTEEAPAKRQLGPRYHVHVRHERYGDEYLASDPVTRTPESWGAIRVQVTRMREDAPRPEGVQKVKHDKVPEMFRLWWYAMADRFKPGTPPEELSFDFDHAWWLRLPPGTAPPWEGTFDDRDWELDPVEGMKNIRGQLAQVMAGHAPESHPPAYVEWSGYDGHAQKWWNSQQGWEDATTDDEDHSQ